MTDWRSMCPEILMVRSVEGEYVQSWSSSLSILVPASRGGARYSVKDFSSPWIQDRDSTVRLPRRPLITLREWEVLLSEPMFSSIFCRIQSPERSEEHT